MTTDNRTSTELLNDMKNLQLHLKEAEDTLQAIHSGEVDALIISGPNGERVFSLQGTEHAYRELVENMNVGAAFLSPKGIITYCNKQLADLFQVPIESLIGTPLADYIANQSQLLVTDSGKNHILEANQTEIILNNGTTGLLFSKPMDFNDIALQGLGIIFTDITELKKTAQKLKDSLLYNQGLLEASLDSLMTLSHDGKIMDANLATMKSTGLSHDQLIGTNFSDCFTEPDLAYKAYQQAITQSFIKNRPLTMRHVSGKDKIVLCNASVLKTPQGEVTGVFMAARDITDYNRALQALEVNLLYTKNLIEASQDLLVTLTVEGKIMSANKATEGLTGITRPQLVGSDFYSYFVEPEKVLAAHNEALIKGTINEYPLTIKHISGAIYDVLYNISTYRNKNGGIEGVLGVARNVTERKKTEIQLQLAASVFTHAREGIMITDSKGRIIQVNDAFSIISGYTREEVLGKNPRILSSGRQEKAIYTAMWHDLTTKGHWYGEFWNRHKNGEVYAVMENISLVANSQDKSRQYVALMSDITNSKRHEQELEHSAHYDALTNLPNRVLLSDRIQQAIAKSRRSKEVIALVFLDLDGFKAINDTHGHLAGDHLLIAVAQNMSAILREVDTLARIGGDEFIALLVDVGDIRASEPLFERLLAATSNPVPFGEFVLQVSASMGITFYPQLEEVDVDILIRQADQAMYIAKQTGKNRYHVFDVDMDKLTRAHNEDLVSIRQALVAGEFELYYQPKVNLRLGTIIGAEALIRWQHPVKGLITPSEFLPLIENHPLSIDVGMWVIKTAMEQIESWKSSGLSLPISINISALQLQQDDFIACLQAFLKVHPTVLPGDLVMEILETSAMRDLSKVSRLIEDCRELGISFSLDDFGTGYSSLTYLKRLPINQLKIDQSFVRDMLNDIDDLTIVEGVLALANAFNLEVIAEGMETTKQGEMLLQMGCDKAQGYAIAHPLPAKEVANWVANWQPDTSWLDRPSFTRDDLPLLFANAEYNAWLNGIEHYLHLKGPKPEKPSSRFGRWLTINSPLKQGNHTSLLTLHQELYALAEQLVELHETGQHNKALSGLAKLHKLHKTILENVELLVTENWK